MGSRVSNCIILPNFVAIGQTVAEIWRFFNFSIFPIRQLLAILDLLCACFEHHEAHLVVFITVQNLVGIDAVISIICMLFISIVWHENAYSDLQNCGFGEIVTKPVHRLQIRPIVHN